MAKKRSAQLDQEVREALAKIPRKPLKTREQLDAEIDAVLAGGLAAERHEVAEALGFRYPKRAPSKPKSLTGTNLFALTEMVLEHGPEFPSRMHAVHHPHLKRALDLGYIEPASASTVKLTPAGREVVADQIVKDIDRVSRYTPQVSPIVRPELRDEVLARERAKHQAELDKLERAIAKLRRA